MGNLVYDNLFQILLTVSSELYVMLCINFITDQNSEEHIRSCLQQEKLSTKVYNAVMLYIIMYNNNTCIMKIKVKVAL